MTSPSLATQREVVSPHPTTWRLRRAISQTLYTAGRLLTLFFVVFPILWLVLTAFKDPIDVYTVKIFFTPTLDNFRAIFDNPLVIGPKLVNSLIVAVCTLAIAIPLSAMAAYALSRFHFMGGNAIFVGILAVQFIPSVVVVIPFFVLFRQLGLIDKLPALIIVDLAIVTPYAIWLMKGFVDALPGEIEQAARVDGAGEFQVLRHIVAPLVMPGIIVSSVFSFITVWNEFLFAFVLTRSNATTVMVGLLNTSGVRGIMWEQMAAAALLIMAPIILISALIREHFVQGLTLGAVK